MFMKMSAFCLKVIGAVTAVIKKKVPQMLSMVGLAPKVQVKAEELGRRSESSCCKSSCQ